MRSFAAFRPSCFFFFFFFLPLRVSYTLLSCWRLWRLDHHVCIWPLRIFYTLLSFWRRLWRLDHYVYNWPLRVFHTLLSLSRRLWHLDHYVYVWPSRIFRPFCVFDIVSRVRPLWVRYSVCRVYTITSVCLTFWSLYTLLAPLAAYIYWQIINMSVSSCVTGGQHALQIFVLQAVGAVLCFSY